MNVDKTYSQLYKLSILRVCFDDLKFRYDLYEKPAHGFVIYAGDENQKRSVGQLVSWRSLQPLKDL